MYQLWKRFLEEAGLNIEAGNCQQFRTYIYVLRRLGLIEKAGVLLPQKETFQETIIL